MLQVGSASVDITPNLGCHLIGYFNDRIATAIHDPLHAKALAISNGEMTIGIVVCDLIAVPGDVVRAAKERIASETGVPPERVMICATHTHTGPSIKSSLGTPATEGYAEWVVRASPTRLSRRRASFARRRSPSPGATAPPKCTTGGVS